MNKAKSARKTEPISAFGALKGAGIIMAVISGTVNVLALTGSFYMLQVYDRVLSSHSISTLVALSILAAGLYLFMGALEVTRAQILVRLGGRVDRKLITTAHEAAMRLPLLGKRAAEAQQPIRDVDTIRGFLSGQGPIAILDMPWMPLYLAFIFILHPLLGWVTVCGALVLILMTLTTEKLTRAPAMALVTSASSRRSVAEASSRNAEVLRAMGFGHRAMHRFAAASAEHLAAQEKLSDLTSGFSTASRVFRLVVQSALLGLGAYLTIMGEMSAGAIIASSIASARAFAPIEVAIANWKGFVAARHSAARLNQLFASLANKVDPLELPVPKSTVSLEGVTVAIPGSQRAVLSNVSFELKAGQALAVIGPSAAGKSSLARAVVGVWGLARGSICVDGAPLDRWNPEKLGEHIGYLPQDVELFDGTVTENISRFEENADSKKVIDAAQASGVHGMILRLPEGYETLIGERGCALSAGQRQRIALARALYGKPFLVVLDEPNSNLDSEGEEALAKAIQSVRSRGGVVMVVAHRPGVLAVVDLIAVVGNGQITAFGPRDEVLKKAVKPAPAATPVVAQQGTRPARPPSAGPVTAAVIPAQRVKAVTS